MASDDEDVQTASQRLFQAIASGGDLTAWLHPSLRVHRKGIHLAGDDARDLVRARQGSAGHQWSLETVLVRRNVVFVSWRCTGPEPGSGTWVWSFDRDGRVLEWTELEA